MPFDIPLKEGQAQVFEVIDRFLREAKRQGQDLGYVLRSVHGHEIGFEYVDAHGDKFEIFARFGKRIGREAFSIDTSVRTAWFEPVQESDPDPTPSGYRLRPDCNGAIMRAFFGTYQDLLW